MPADPPIDLDDWLPKPADPHAPPAPARAGAGRAVGRRRARSASTRRARSGASCAGGSRACRPTSASARCSPRHRSRCWPRAPSWSLSGLAGGSGRCAATTPSCPTPRSSVHVHEQLHKALDRKVWLPSGGSLIIERTEALTVIDVNTGKNVGRSRTSRRRSTGTTSRPPTRWRGSCGCATSAGSSSSTSSTWRSRRTATRSNGPSARRSPGTRPAPRSSTITELGLVEMTRKRVSEGLVEAFSETCTICGGRGFVLDESMLE